MSTPNLHMILLAIFATFAVSTRCNMNQSPHGVALFIFGDSLADAGTNNYINTTSYFKANFYPYGETFFHYPTGRPSNGRLTVDFIAEYAKLPFIPPYVRLQEHGFMGGANFAGGGAGALVDTFQGLVSNLHMQLKQMEELEKILRKELGNEKAKTIISEGVYFICIGSNDYVARVADNPTPFQSISMEDYVGMGIYEVGGRKFAVMGVGQIGCVPGMRSSTRNGSCSDEVNKLAKLHNTALTAILPKLESQLQGFKYSYFDFYTALSE
ncbi:GDSL lipase-like [Eucalyptus grandis]|uniref:GDSL lipase-like n=1 Tax=Eucalyptus grandis TaxID=71139 RepID=UPI00192EF472|nr:GDSL lipase-like [Eucalyptus grandis]